MKICPYCSHANREGELFCAECGEILTNVQSDPTSTKRLEVNNDPAQGKNAWGTAHFGEESVIMLHVRDASDPVTLQSSAEVTLGRSDSTSNTLPNFDLTPYGAKEKGVSRIHAAIRRGEDTLTLIDLGSVNGSYLNGQRLIPNQPRVLRDGDEIRLGKLVCHVYFK